MFDITKKTYERNGIKTIVHNDGVLWLNEKHIEEGLHDKNLQEIIMKYHSSYRNHRCKLAEEPKKPCNRIFIDEKLVVKTIMDCRTISTDNNNDII